jgi:hypothetical protein
MLMDKFSSTWSGTSTPLAFSYTRFFIFFTRRTPSARHTSWKLVSGSEWGRKTATTFTKPSFGGNGGNVRTREDAFTPDIIHLEDCGRFAGILIAPNPKTMTPERELCLAVLETAIHEWNFTELQPQIREWMEGADARMTFEYVCDTLDLDPDYIRRGLYEKVPKR